MKLKITVGKLNQVDQFAPIAQDDFSADNPAMAMEAFKKFFSDNPDLSLPQEVENILQAGDPWTVSTVLSIKYYLSEVGLGLEYYAFSEEEDSILSNITRSSGMLLLDEAQMYHGFIPRGYFLRFDNEEDANPIKVYNWIGNTVKLFPSSSSDPYNAALTQTKEIFDMVGTVSTPIVARFMKYLAAFKKRVVII